MHDWMDWVLLVVSMRWVAVLTILTRPPYMAEEECREASRSSSRLARGSLELGRGWRMSGLKPPGSGTGHWHQWSPLIYTPPTSALPHLHTHTCGMIQHNATSVFYMLLQHQVNNMNMKLCYCQFISCLQCPTSTVLQWLDKYDPGQSSPRTIPGPVESSWLLLCNNNSMSHCLTL